MLAPQSRSFATTLTCMLSRPEESTRSRPEWYGADEQCWSDFQQLRADSNFTQEAEELSAALEQYQLLHRRRCLSFEEMIAILHSLGYRRGGMEN